MVSAGKDHVVSFDWCESGFFVGIVSILSQLGKSAMQECIARSRLVLGLKSCTRLDLGLNLAHDLFSRSVEGCV